METYNIGKKDQTNMINRLSIFVQTIKFARDQKKKDIVTANKILATSVFPLLKKIKDPINRAAIAVGM
jgi:hypothetical protein